jgi:hypothetical protein
MGSMLHSKRQSKLDCSSLSCSLVFFIVTLFFGGVFNICYLVSFSQHTHTQTHTHTYAHILLIIIFFFIHYNLKRQQQCKPDFNPTLSTPFPHRFIHLHPLYHHIHPSHSLPSVFSFCYVHVGIYSFFQIVDKRFPSCILVLFRGVARRIQVAWWEVRV